MGNIFLTERKILLVKMMANHQHIQVLINGISSKWSCRIGGRRNAVWFAAHFDDVRCVATSCPFRMIGVYCPAFECCNCIFHTTRFVESVGVNKHLQDKF